VSEGLIFRHFKNKEGLLEAIIKEGEERAKILFSDIVFETDPKEVLRKTIETFNPRKTEKSELDFWKLQYKIKWELEMYGEQKMEPLHLALTSAFTKLGYSYPELESLQLQVILDGLATRYFLMKQFDLEPMLTFLINKYKL
jgi:AcrR family transcriptional regulator